MFILTNLSQNPYRAAVREAYTEDSPSWDEFHFVNALTPYLEEAGVPAHFLVDQGRVSLPGGREEWSEWCNINPAGYVPSHLTYILPPFHTRFN